MASSFFVETRPRRRILARYGGRRFGGACCCSSSSAGGGTGGGGCFVRGGRRCRRRLWACAARRLARLCCRRSVNTNESAASVSILRNVGAVLASSIFVETCPRRRVGAFIRRSTPTFSFAATGTTASLAGFEGTGSVDANKTAASVSILRNVGAILASSIFVETCP